MSEDGPFVFQSKFVENANSAGARFDQIIINAVNKEIAQIKQRQAKRSWKRPRHYVLLTNAPLSGSLRKKLQSTFGKAFPRVKFHSLAGNDVCAILDSHPTLRRSFPQLFSLRDLDELLAQATSRDIIEKSRSAIELARDIAPVFVPTSAYEGAWKILRKHHFVVLEGPPEMGKTSIAWMIALAQISQGWRAVVCDDPKEVFETVDASTSQIFIADDAFGRTEYDPARGSKWETQLERIFRRLDQNHWLVWTSRKHILERACRQLDLQGSAANFPNPGAILVNASKLVKREKALILYRHARAARLEEEAKALIKKYATQLVDDPSFTPERIRRMVKERLPI
ncbi:MAG: hypothetical protein ACREGC_03170, partial [Minisyncoccia bacterium]